MTRLMTFDSSETLEESVSRVRQIPDPLERALRLVGDQYSLQIIQVLLQRSPQRFIELEQAIQGISPRTLSARLKGLQASGLIHRKQFSSLPPRVDYSLSERGESLTAVVAALSTWAEQAYPSR